MRFIYPETVEAAIAAILDRPAPEPKPVIDPAEEAHILAEETRCSKCYGTGYISWQENQAPYGSGEYWPETFYDLCPNCLGNNLCPSCGVELAVDDDGYLLDEGTCRVCGWALRNDEVLHELTEEYY